MKTTFQDEQISNFQPTGDSVSFNSCELINTDFNHAVLSDYEFSDCTFVGCDLSMAIIEDTVFNSVTFIDCKMLGLDFTKVSKFLFSVKFERCILDYILFNKNLLKKTCFSMCSIKEATFVDCIMEEAKFLQCNLQETRFEGCDLRKADFSSATGYVINPQLNKIKKAKFSYPDLLVLLDGFDIIIK
jgi:uncharacterized protein YjbI with pentapeptide repeats